MITFKVFLLYVLSLCFFGFESAGRNGAYCMGLSPCGDGSGLGRCPLQKRNPQAVEAWGFTLFYCRIAVLYGFLSFFVFFSQGGRESR